jgi:membrane protease subunit HflK
MARAAPAANRVRRSDGLLERIDAMSWNNGGGNSPWGNPGGNQGPRPDKGGERGPDRGPWGSGGRGPGQTGLPDLDDLIARMQDKARRFVPGGPGGFMGRNGGGRLWAIFVLVAIALWMVSGFYRVQPDQQGIVLRFGAFERTTLPGLNYHLPWPIEQAQTPAVTRINRVEVGFRGAAGDRTSVLRVPGRDSSGASAREVPEEALMLTGDENIIDINFSVFWRIRDAGAFLFNTRNPEETVKSAAESMMREVIGRTPIQPALTEARARIEQDVTTGTQAILDQYGAGVEITQVPPSSTVSGMCSARRPTLSASATRLKAIATTSSPAPAATRPG